MLKVVIARPGQEPLQTMIEDTLEDLQEIVGGYIQRIPFSPGIAIIADEEGGLKGNRPDWFIGIRSGAAVTGTRMWGTLIFIGDDGGPEFSSLTDNQAHQIVQMLPKP